MAQNFLDQVLNITGFKLSPKHQDNPDDVTVDQPTITDDCHTAETNKDGLTGIERYLAKKQAQANSKKERLTGVARYLAAKELNEHEKNKVERLEYAHMTGVEKYLFKLSAHQKTQINEKKPPQLSGVEKYLAQQKRTSTIIPESTAKPTVEVIDEIETVVAEEAIEVVIEGEVVVVNETTNASPKEEGNEMSEITNPLPEAVADADVLEPVILIEEEEALETEETTIVMNEALQCQASTAKGTQCRRKNNLLTIIKVIDGQDYPLMVCSQHSHEKSRPYMACLNNPH